MSEEQDLLARIGKLAGKLWVDVPITQLDNTHFVKVPSISTRAKHQLQNTSSANIPSLHTTQSHRAQRRGDLQEQLHTAEDGGELGVTQRVLIETARLF